MRIGFVVAGALLLTGLAAPADAFRYVDVGARVPALTLLDADGHRVTFPRSGQPAVIVFGRADHPLSDAALTDVAALARDDRRVDVLAVVDAAGDRARGGARGAPPLLVDRDGRAGEAWGVIVYPSTAVVDADGRLRYYLPSRGHGYRALLDSHLLRARGEISDAELARRLAQAGGDGGSVAQAQAAYNRGLEALRARHFDAAVQDLTRALALAPDLLDARLQLGWARLEQGDAAAARQDFEAVLARRPEAPAARVGAGVARLRLGQTREGITVLEEAVVLNPEPVRAHWELARAYETLGERSRALEHYRWAYLKLLQGRK